MHHQYLTICAITGTDADDRNAQRLGDALGQAAGHTLQHQQLNASGLQRQGVTVDLFGLGQVAPLNAEAAKDVD